MSVSLEVMNPEGMRTSTMTSVAIFAQGACTSRTLAWGGRETPRAATRARPS